MDRPRRIGLRQRNARDGRERGATRCQMQKFSTGKFQGKSPWQLKRYPNSNASESSHEPRSWPEASLGVARRSGCCRAGSGHRADTVNWLLLQSRPEEFHPEPLTEPDLILSHHPARAIARRLPPSAEPSGSSWFDPVGPRSTAMTHPLRSTGITPLHHYYRAVRPSPAHRYFRPRGWSRLRLFPWHRRPGSHVPYKSQIEFRAAYMPDAAWAVSVHPPSFGSAPGFDIV